MKLGDAAIGKIAYEPGWRWSVDIGPRVGTPLCETHHIGVVISGRLQIEMRDGSSLTIGPDDAFEVPPGHDAWVMGPGTKDEHVVPAERRTPVTRKANLVVTRGVVTGTWSAKGDELVVTWLDPAEPPRRALADEAARLSGILGRSLDLRL